MKEFDMQPSTFTENELLQGASLVLIYRCVALLAGLIVVFLGYRLFRVGVYEKAGDMKAVFGGGRSLVLKAAAPGTFLALFGAAIMGIAVWRGIVLDKAGGSNTKPILLTNFTSAEVRAAIEKMIKGEKLESKERNSIETWLHEVKQNEGWRIQANQFDLKKYQEMEKKDGRS